MRSFLKPLGGLAVMGLLISVGIIANGGDTAFARDGPSDLVVVSLAGAEPLVQHDPVSGVGDTQPGMIAVVPTSAQHGQDAFALTSKKIDAIEAGPVTSYITTPTKTVADEDTGSVIGWSMNTGVEPAPHLGGHVTALVIGETASLDVGIERGTTLVQQTGTSVMAKQRTLSSSTPAPATMRTGILWMVAILAASYLIFLALRYVRRHEFRPVLAGYGTIPGFVEGLTFGRPGSTTTAGAIRLLALGRALVSRFPGIPGDSGDDQQAGGSGHLDDRH